MPNKPTTLREEFEKLKIPFVKEVFRLWQKHLGKRAETCPGCGGAMYTICEKTMRDMYSQALDKGFSHCLTSHNTELLQKIEGMKLPPEAGKSVFESEQKRRTYEMTGYNQALDEVIKLINQNK